MVAGVTPRRETSSPQFMETDELIASKMRRRVSSASALEIRSISSRSISTIVTNRIHSRQRRDSAPELDVTVNLDTHLIIEVTQMTFSPHLGNGEDYE
jgi:hypothetical protein